MKKGLAISGRDSTEKMPDFPQQDLQDQTHIDQECPQMTKI